MQAAILAVGSELLGTDRLDTNSLAIAGALQEAGVVLTHKAVVGDDEHAIVEELEHLSALCELVVVSGGLGPTRDDLTREAVARLLGARLILDQRLLAQIEARFARMGRVMPPVNRRQAEVIEGAEILENPIGTAPGLRLRHGKATLFLLPGVPRELEGLLERELRPWLLAHGDPARRILEAEVRIACLPESDVEQRITPAYDEFGSRDITVLSRPGEIWVRLRARADEVERLEAMRRRIVELVGDAVFEPSGRRELEAVVGELLLERQATLTTAESCTGGLLGERLTRVPGSSSWYLGGVVSYTNELKSDLLGVDPRLFERYGAVSEEVARAMAEGARGRFSSSYALAITGVAGPAGGSDEKPVGTVHLAMAGPGEPGEPNDVQGTLHRAVRFPGDRQRIRQQASQLSLELLRRRLLGLSVEGAYPARSRA